MSIAFRRHLPSRFFLSKTVQLSCYVATVTSKSNVIKHPTYEQKIGNIWGLLTQNVIPSILRTVLKTLVVNHQWLFFSINVIFQSFGKGLNFNQVFIQQTKVNQSICSLFERR